MRDTEGIARKHHIPNKNELHSKKQQVNSNREVLLSQKAFENNRIERTEGLSGNINVPYSVTIAASGSTRNEVHQKSSADFTKVHNNASEVHGDFTKVHAERQKQR